MINIGSLIASIGGDTSALQASLRQAEAEMRKASDSMASGMDRFNEASKKAGDQLKRVGKQMSKFLTVPMMAAGVGAFKMQKDFEASLTKISSLVGVASEQVDLWSKDIIKMAPQLGKAPEELADALFFVTSAGIKGAEAMEVLEMAAKASASGLGQTKDVADLVTSAMNAYGKENITAAAATDILVATVKEGKAEAPQLAQAMGMVLPIASKMGVQFDEVGAAIAAMTRTGTNANIATTQLRSILIGLEAPGNAAEEAMKNMGTSGAELRKTIKEDGLLKAMMDIRQKTAEYGETAMSKVFPNIRALMGILDLMGENIEDNIEIFDSLSDANGSLAKAFEITAETAEFKWQQALSSSKIALATLGNVVAEAFLPILEKLTGWLTDVSQWFDNLSESQKNMAVWVGAVVAALGPMMGIFGVLVGNVLPKIVLGFGAFRKAIMAAQLGMVKLTAIIAANPIGAIVVGLTAAASAFVYFNNRAKQSQDILGKIHEQAVRNTVKEKVEVEKLARILDNEHASRAQKQRAIEELNRISPEYFGNLKLDEEGNVDATKAIEDYVDALLIKAKAQALQEKLVEVEKKRLEELESGQDRQLTFWQDMSLAFKMLFMSMDDALDALDEAEFDNATESAKEYEEQVRLLQDALDDLFLKEDDEDGVDNATTKIKNQAAAFIDVSDAIKQADTAWGGFLETFKKDMGEDKGLDLDVLFTTDDIDIPLDPMISAFSTYDDMLRQAGVNHKLFGESFDYLGEKISLTEQLIQALVASGRDEMDPTIITLKENLDAMKDSLDETNANLQAGEEKAQAWSDLVQGAGMQISNSLMNMAEAGEISTGEIIKQLIAQATGYLITSIMSSLPFPANIAVAGGAGLLMGSIMGAIPEFAEGGIISGPTLAVVGEYPGASVNPEVIAPLDKLQSLLPTSSGDNEKELAVRVDRGDLLFVLQNAQRIDKRTF